MCETSAEYECTIYSSCTVLTCLNLTIQNACVFQAMGWLSQNYKLEYGTPSKEARTHLDLRVQTWKQHNVQRRTKHKMIFAFVPEEFTLELVESLSVASLDGTSHEHVKIRNCH